MIMAGAGVDRRGDISRAYLTVMDLAPTFIEMASAPYPRDGSVQAMRGESMTSLMSGASDHVHDDDYVTVQFLGNRAFLRQGPWKITQLERPFEESGFALYNLADDPGEVTDLSDQYPEKRKELIALWDKERRARGIIVPQDL
jgi:arylsulfatase